MDHPAPPAGNEERQRCALTGEAALPSALLCFVLDPAGKVVFDMKRNLPVTERLWLSPRRSVVERAMTEGVFASLGGNATWQEDLPQRVEGQLRRHLQEMLHLLRRSGGLVGGFEKVRAAMDRGMVAALVQANDASEDGRRKLANLARHHHIPVIGLFGRAALASVTRQENQTHLALMHGGLAARFIEESHRLAEYIDAPDGRQG